MYRMSESKKLNKLWAEFVKTKDPTVLQAIQNEAGPLVFLVAYKHLQDKKKAAFVAKETLFLLAQDHPAPKDFEKWLLKIVYEKLSKLMFGSKDKQT